MSVRFLLGASGTGKSSLLIRQVLRHAEEHPDQHHIVFVPEQFTFETQRQFIAAHPRGAMLNIEAVSFGHMMRRVDRELSAETLQLLDETGKRMLLSLAVRDTEKSLSVYGRQTRRPGFLKKLSGLLTEWDMNDLSPERLEQLAEESSLTPLLQNKLRDLSRIYKAFKARLGSGRMTAEEGLPRLARLLPRSDFARGAFLYFDGFTGFTSVQYRIITELIRRSPETLFAFTLPEGEKTEPAAGKAAHTELFGMTKEALRQLERCAEEAGQLVREPLYAAGAERPEDLDFLEKNFLRPCRESFPAAPEHVEAVSARNAREECAAAAEKVMTLLREEKLRCRDIALVVSDQELYVPLLEELLKEAGLPFFTDRRAPLQYHPLIRLIEAALEAVAGLRRDSVLRFLKNSCGPLSREESDLFENYLLEAGIRSSRQFCGPFIRGPRRRRNESDEEYAVRTEKCLEEMNALRERALTPLLRLKEGFAAAETAAEYCNAVRTLLTALRTEEKITQQAAALEQAGRYREARTWQEVGIQTEKFLEDTGLLLGDMPVSGQEFTDILKAGLEELRLGLLPDEPDQLIIGDVERSRFGRVEALLFLGMNEGLVPRYEGSGIITDRERALLGVLEPDMGYTGERALFEARFYLYRLLTKPRKELYISFSRTDGSGRAQAPSPILLEVLRLFPRLNVTDRSSVSAGDRVYSKETAVRALAAQLCRREPSGWEELYRFLARQPEMEKSLSLLEKGALALYKEKSLSREEARNLYGQILSGSVTRLENFANCPFSHFLAYGLGLQERKTADFDERAHGDFFHKVMEVMLRELKNKEMKIGDLDTAGRENLVDLAMQAAVGNSGNTELADRSDREYYLSRWRDFFLRRLEAMGLNETEGGFSPEAFEQHFGGEIPGLLLELGEGARMYLGGVIDRIDTLRSEDRIYLRVVDYKTGDKGAPDPEKLQEGLELQLAAYLEAALRHYRNREPEKTVLPGGLYYAELREDWKNPEQEARKALLDSAKMKGFTAAEVKDRCPDVSTDKGRNVLSADTLAAFGEYAAEKMAALGREILEGRISVSPRDTETSCKYCRFRSVCRFDRKIPGTTDRQPREKPDGEKANERKSRCIEEIRRMTGRGEENGVQ